MLTGTRNPELYREWERFIEARETRAAFRYLVGIAACSAKYHCHIQWKGKVRDFRFHDRDGKQPFAFITNQRWLLFYVRLPAVRGTSTSTLKELKRAFDDAKLNAAGEWTIKLKSISDVDLLRQFIDI